MAILAHNEAANLPSAIKSIIWADQVVVVDASSTDGTGDVARSSGAEVYAAPNVANLNVNKNLAIDHCGGEWVLVLDADERIPDDLAGEIRRAMADGKADGFLIPRRNYVMGRWLRHGSQFPDWQLRLFRRTSGRFQAGHVHERLTVRGRVGRMACAMDHHPYPDLSTLLRKSHFYAEFEADRLIEKGASVGAAGLLLKGFVRPLGRLFRRLILRGGILDGAPGIMIAAFDYWNQALRWMLVWENGRKSKPQGSSSKNIVL